MEKVLKLGAVEGRHVINGIDGYVLHAVEDVTNLNGIEKAVNASLDEKLVGYDKLALYVTGLTSVVLAVVKYCYANDIELSCYHFDRDSNDYFEQVIR